MNNKSSTKETEEEGEHKKKKMTEMANISVDNKDINNPKIPIQHYMLRLDSFHTSRICLWAGFTVFVSVMSVLAIPTFTMSHVRQ